MAGKKMKLDDSGVETSDLEDEFYVFEEHEHSAKEDETQGATSGGGSTWVPSQGI